MWTVAITTAPRRECTLLPCLESLADCGWDPVVFAEPNSTTNPYLTIHHPQKLGVWHNWLYSVRWCLSNTDSPVIMTVQDDCLFHPQSKEYIETQLWPENCGFISLYTPKHYTKPSGIHRIFTRSLWGACALVWPRQVLESLLTLPLINSWMGVGPKSKNPVVMERRRADSSLIANSDTAIGKLVNQLNLAMYFVNPSLVDHFAAYSTIGHGGNKGRRNASVIADPSLPLSYYGLCQTQNINDANKSA